jgi:hypothetical protein
VLEDVDPVVVVGEGAGVGALGEDGASGPVVVLHALVAALTVAR